MVRARHLGIGLFLASASAAFGDPTLYVNTGIDGSDFDPGDGVCEIAPGNGVCTLRAAIQEATHWANAPVMVPAITIQVAFGAILVDSSVSIYGSGMHSTTIQPNPAAPPSGLLWADDLGDLRLWDLAIIGFGDTAVTSYAKLDVQRCSFNLNVGAQVGGAIAHGDPSGLLDFTVYRSIFQSNGAELAGGAVYSDGNFICDQCSFLDNFAPAAGAVLAEDHSHQAYLRIQRSLLNNNWATGGPAGALGLSGVHYVDLVDSTFAYNQATNDGGAILAANLDVFNIVSSTIANNTCDSDLDGSGEGGGLDAVIQIQPALIYNSILASNTGSITIEPEGNVWAWPQDCAGSVTSATNNIIRANDEALCAITGAYSQADPQLHALGWNGGFTQTMAIAPGSPAIDAGSSECAGWGTDQRLSPAPYGASCDLGAFEYGSLIFTDDFEDLGWGHWSVIGV